MSACIRRVPPPHLQIAACAGSADVVALFLASDSSLATIVKGSTGNTLLHYAALGPPHVADVYKSGEKGGR